MSYYDEFRCPHCKKIDPPTVEDPSRGDLICTNCGMILAEKQISTDTEYRTFSESTSDRRHYNQDKNILGTTELRTSVSAVAAPGQTVSQEAQSLIRTSERQETSCEERRLKEFFNILRSLSQGPLQLTQVLEKKTESILVPFLRANPVTGNERKKRAVVAAAIVIASKQVGARRAFNEVSAACGLEKKDVGSSFKKITNFYKDHGDGQQLKQVEESPAQFLPEVLSSLRLNEMLGEATRVMKRLQALRQTSHHALSILGGKSPLTLVACVVFKVAQHLQAQGRLKGARLVDARARQEGTTRPVVVNGVLEFDRRDVAESARIAENTLQSALKDLKEFHDDLFPPGK